MSEEKKSTYVTLSFKVPVELWELIKKRFGESSNQEMFLNLVFTKIAAWQREDTYDRMSDLARAMRKEIREKEAEAYRKKVEKQCRENLKKRKKEATGEEKKGT